MLEERRGHDARRWEPFLPISASDAVRDSVVYAAWDPTDDPVDELVDLIADARASIWTVNQDENYAEPGLIQRQVDEISACRSPIMVNLDSVGLGLYQISGTNREAVDLAELFLTSCLGQN